MTDEFGGKPHRFFKKSRNFFMRKSGGRDFGRSGDSRAGGEDMDKLRDAPCSKCARCPNNHGLTRNPVYIPERLKIFGRKVGCRFWHSFDCENRVV